MDTELRNLTATLDRLEEKFDRLQESFQELDDRIAELEDQEILDGGYSIWSKDSAVASTQRANKKKK